MFAQRHIFFRLRAFISGCLAALDAAPPFAVDLVQARFKSFKSEIFTIFLILVVFFVVGHRRTPKIPPLSGIFVFLLNFLDFRPKEGGEN